MRLGKAGSDLEADAEAIGRLLSLILRLPSPMTREERLREVIDQLEHIGGSRFSGFGPERVRSMPDGIARVLSRWVETVIGTEPALSLQPDRGCGLAQWKTSFSGNHRRFLPEMPPGLSHHSTGLPQMHGLRLQRMLKL